MASSSDAANTPLLGGSGTTVQHDDGQGLPSLARVSHGARSHAYRSLAEAPFQSILLPQESLEGKNQLSTFSGVIMPCVLGCAKSHFFFFFFFFFDVPLAFGMVLVIDCFCCSPLPLFLQPRDRTLKRVFGVIIFLRYARR